MEIKEFKEKYNKNCIRDIPLFENQVQYIEFRIKKGQNFQKNIENFNHDLYRLKNSSKHPIDTITSGSLTKEIIKIFILKR